MVWPFNSKKTPPETKMPPLPTDPKELADYQEFLRQKAAAGAAQAPTSAPSEAPELEEIDPAEITGAIDGVIAERDAAVTLANTAKAERDEAINAKTAALAERDAALAAKAEAVGKVAGLEKRAGDAEKERDAAVKEAARVTAEFQKLGATIAKLRKPKA